MLPVSLDDVQNRRVGLFLAFAFGISWTVGAVLYATGGLADSPELGYGITLAGVLLPTGYMFGPAIANVLVRALTGEGRTALGLRPRLRRTWPYWLAAWLLPAILISLGTALYFALFPGQFDASLESARESLAEVGVDLAPEVLVAVQVGGALVAGPTINALVAFGEEFGWRGYLLPKLLPLGERRATLLVGAIWGVWHWPVILMGYNYGFDYPGAPVLGPLAMVLVTVVWGVFLAWVTLRSGSVWPAAIGHGSINAVAAIGLLFVREGANPNPLLGPTGVGAIVLIPWAALAAWLVWRRSALDPPRTDAG